jgi:hypothetical protein
LDVRFRQRAGQKILQNLLSTRKLKSMNRKLEETEILLCRCHSDEHQILVHFNEDDKELYLDVHLSPYHNFWQRLWRGLKYIFGYRCKYGHWDCFIFNENNADKLQAMADALKTIKDE